jgi:hypothetical protein
MATTPKQKTPEKKALHDEDGNTVERWSKKTLPKKVTSSVIADAWRGGLRAWRGELRGPLRENREQFHGAFVGESKLDEEAAIKSIREEAAQSGLEFDLSATRRALMRVARENYQRLTAETFTKQSL